MSDEAVLMGKYPSGRSLWLSPTMFLLIFIGLQWGWDQSRGTTLERWFLDDVTVGTSVVAINMLTPHLAAVAQGASILATGGGINVRNGCEGTEIWFLLLAALATYPFLWRVRLIGLLAGTAFVFVINQIRLLGLFYALRNNRALFDHIHGLIAPLVLITCTISFFLILLRADQRARITHV